MDMFNGMSMPYGGPSTGSSLASLFLAAVVPLLLLKAFSFFNHTWPNFLYSLLTARLNRQIATVAERVHPNRIIQDDILVQAIMGYVSYCYVRTLKQGPNACDTVPMADYDYNFVFENVPDFTDDWVPPSTRFQTLFGRVIASAMELSVVPSTGQAIQVEPGLFVRSLEDKHMRREKKHGNGGGHESGGESDDGGSAETGHRPNRGSKGSVPRDHADKLNRYVFHDMRTYAENMEEHPQPAADGNADDVSSVGRPFDAAAARQGRRGRGGRNGDSKKGSKASSTVFNDDERPQLEHFLVLEYRRPLPYEQGQALSSGDGVDRNVFDASGAAGDVIEGFLARAHGWYLAHVAQSKLSPLMAVYPSPALSMFGKLGTNVFSGAAGGGGDDGDFNGRCYVLDSTAITARAEEKDHSGGATQGQFEKRGGVTASPTVASPPTSGRATTIAGGHVGLRGSSPSLTSTSTSLGKTFRSLFFPAKADVLRVLDDFVHERGRFAVAGVVPRLNFFLHGAPGTGKTSFVKALARHLGRHLIVVSMSEIVTVSELQKLLQPCEIAYTTNREQRRFSVRPHQSVYVFEDFDAIGDAWEALMQDQQERRLVAERERQQKAEHKQKKKEEEGEGAGESAGDSASASESTGSRRTQENSRDSQQEAEKNGGEDCDGGGPPCSRGESEKDDAAGSTSPSTSSASKTHADDDDDDDDASDGDEEEGESKSHSTASSTSTRCGSKNFLLKDNVLAELDRTHLTVERFMDLFNGFNLPDSFIAVFTTNHPEKIHPRILSSNMMDVTLDMGVLDAACATQMVEHYFRDELADDTERESPESTERLRHLRPAQQAALHAALKLFNASSRGLSGAQLEKMCIECDTVEALTQRLTAVDSWDITDVF